MAEPSKIPAIIEGLKHRLDTEELSARDRREIEGDIAYLTELLET